MSTYVTQADLEAQFTAERVAQVFSVQAADGSTTGSVDSTSLNWCIAKASAEVDEVLFGIHSAADLATVPDTIKEIAAVFTMYRGTLRRPEYRGDLKSLPYRQDYEDARDRLMKMREAYLRMSRDYPPANVGGQYTTSLPESVGSFVFNADPSTGTGGFNSGDF
jgi:phage gp36-like protein